MDGVCNYVGDEVGEVDRFCVEGYVGDENLFVLGGIGECCDGCKGDVHLVVDRGVDV